MPKKPCTATIDGTTYTKDELQSAIINGKFDDILFDNLKGKSFTTSKGQTIKGKDLQDALNKIADDRVEAAKRKRKEKYASHVTEKQKDAILEKDLKLADDIRSGEKLNEVWLQQLLEYELTGESIPILPKEDAIVRGEFDELLGEQGAAKEITTEVTEQTKPTEPKPEKESMVGKTVEFEFAGSPTKGEVKGIDEKGNLKVEDKQGIKYTVKPKDATVDVEASKISQAKAELDSALKELRDITDLTKLGVKGVDPEKQAEAMYKVHKALVKYAKEYISKGINDIKKFAKDLGISVKNAQQAWDEALGRITHTKETVDYDLADITKTAIRRGINAREKMAELVKAKKDIGEAVKAFMDDAEIKGSLSTRELKSLVKKAANITTEGQLQKFTEYADKIISNANYVEDIANLRDAAKQVRKGKHGRFTQMVKEFASIDPETLTETNLEKYKEAIDALNQKVPSYDKMAEHYNEIMTDVDAVEKEYSNIKTFEDASKKFDKIQGQEVKTVDDYKTLSRNISGLKNRLMNLLADGSISQEDYTYLMEQVESKETEIGGRLAGEIDALKESQVREIKSTPLDRSQLTPQENAVLDRVNQLSPEDLKQLSVGDLETLNESLKRVEQGFVPMQRVTDIVNKAEAKKFAPKVVSELNQATNADVAKAGLTRDMKLNESSFISRLLGAKEGGAVDKYIINPIVRGLTQYRKDVSTANEKWLEAKKKAFGTFTLSSTKKKAMNKLGIVFNMVQNLNGDAPPDWVILSGNKAEIEKYVNQFEASKQESVRRNIEQQQNILSGDKAKYKMIQEQYKELLKKYDAGDGTIDLEKLKKGVEDGSAFSESEKALFDAIMDIDADLKVKQQAANEIQGKEFGAVEYHTKRIPLGGDIDIKEKVESVKPSMRAGSGKSRKLNDMPRAIETDVEKIITQSIDETNKDYYSLNALKYANEVVKETAKQGRFSNNALNAIRDNMQSRINREFAKSETTIGGKLLAARMASSLIDVGRAALETATAFTYTPLRAGNLKGYATFFNPNARSIAHKLIMDTNSSLGLKHFNKQLEAGQEVNSKNLLVQLGEKVMTFPEHATLDMAWMPRFESAFKEITGQDFDGKQYETSKDYRDNYHQAIMDAATEADVVAKQIVGGGLKFEGREQIRVLPKFMEKAGVKTSVDANSYPGKIAGFFGTYTARESKEFFDGFMKIYKGGKSGDIGEVGKGGGKVLATAIGAVGYGAGMALYNALWTKYTSDNKDYKEKAQNVIDNFYTWKGWTQETASQMAFLGASRYGAIGRLATLLGISTAYNATEDKAEKEQIRQFSKSQLFTEPLDFSGKWGTQAQNVKTLSSLEPYWAYAAKKILEAGADGNDYFDLAKKVEKNGFSVLDRKSTRLNSSHT